jgi:MYXO-CTERM domain-containing protein
MHHRRGIIAGTAVLGAALALATVTTPRPANACGGLFCATTPVDQNAERILFEVHADGAVTATVEITYNGDPDEFSWIVPVTETPSAMDVAPASSLRMLDMATGPQIIPPPTTCSDPYRFGFDDALPGAPPPSADASAGAENGGVTVEDLPVVGPFDPEVISADDPQLLVDWLEENGYLITDEMRPFIAEYVGEGFKFLGVKLTPDAGVNDIAPLSFTCPAGNPMVPLKLTAIASEPEMGIMVFVAGAQRYAAQNFRMLQVDTDQVQFDPRTGSSNYYPLVSWLVDNDGGNAFVTEYASPSSETVNAVNNVGLFTNDAEESRTYLNDVLGEHGYITRMYTRMSGWEMIDDPVFASVNADDVSNVHDLSDRPPVEVCADTGFEPIPCGETYCGVGSICATTESGVDACACESGTVARAITAPRGRGLGLARTVTCQETDLDMLQSALGQIADPCAGFGCGEGGQCIPVNGFPTCECNEGFAARVDFQQSNGLECEAVVETFQPEQLLWPEGIGARAGAECACTSAPSGTAGTLFGVATLLGTLGLALRRRRR